MHLADATDEEAPETPCLPEAIIRRVSPEHEQQPQGAAKEQVRARVESGREEADRLWVLDVAPPNHNGEYSVCEKMREDTLEFEGSGESKKADQPVAGRVTLSGDERIGTHRSWSLLAKDLIYILFGQPRIHCSCCSAMRQQGISQSICSSIFAVE